MADKKTLLQLSDEEMSRLKARLQKKRVVKTLEALKNQGFSEKFIALLIGDIRNGETRNLWNTVDRFLKSDWEEPRTNGLIRQIESLEEKLKEDEKLPGKSLEEKFSITLRIQIHDSPKLPLELTQELLRAIDSKKLEGLVEDCNALYPSARSVSCHRNVGISYVSIKKYIRKNSKPKLKAQGKMSRLAWYILYKHPEMVPEKLRIKAGSLLFKSFLARVEVAGLAPKALKVIARELRIPQTRLLRYFVDRHVRMSQASVS